MFCDGDHTSGVWRKRHTALFFMPYLDSRRLMSHAVAGASGYLVVITAVPTRFPAFRAASCSCLVTGELNGLYWMPPLSYCIDPRTTSRDAPAHRGHAFRKLTFWRPKKVSNSTAYWESVGPWSASQPLRPMVCRSFAQPWSIEPPWTGESREICLGTAECPSQPSKLDRLMAQATPAGGFRSMTGPRPGPDREMMRFVMC
jgi:hypothetical protein